MQTVPYRVPLPAASFLQQYPKRNRIGIWVAPAGAEGWPETSGGSLHSDKLPPLCQQLLLLLFYPASGLIGEADALQAHYLDF